LVRLPAPPPGRLPNPIFHTLPAGTEFFRLFDPTRHNTTAASFRCFGPLLRIDHHRAAGSEPTQDADRGIYYGGFTLSCCLVEVFGDTGFIDCGSWHIAMPRLSREVRLLDLRGNGAMRAGSAAAIGKVPEHGLSQEWSRHFYVAPEYHQPEGLLWYNAHNDEDALALYERAEDALDCPPERVIRLDEPLLRPALEQIAETNHLVLVP
jgi:hypothetical protein